MKRQPGQPSLTGSQRYAGKAIRIKADALYAVEHRGVWIAASGSRPIAADRGMQGRTLEGASNISAALPGYRLVMRKAYERFE